MSVKARLLRSRVSKIPPSKVTPYTIVSARKAPCVSIIPAVQTKLAQNIDLISLCSKNFPLYFCLVESRDAVCRRGKARARTALEGAEGMFRTVAPPRPVSVPEAEPLEMDLY